MIYGKRDRNDLAVIASFLTILLNDSWRGTITHFRGGIVLTGVLKIVLHRGYTLSWEKNLNNCLGYIFNTPFVERRLRLLGLIVSLLRISVI